MNNDNAETQASIKKRIAEIDAMFDAATGWRSWMAEASKERESLAALIAKDEANV